MVCVVMRAFVFSVDISRNNKHVVVAVRSRVVSIHVLGTIQTKGIWCSHSSNTSLSLLLLVADDVDVRVHDYGLDKYAGDLCVPGHLHVNQVK